MNGEMETELELEIVELGDAKEETKGAGTKLPAEVGTEYMRRSA